jgi:hypothetical protein
MIFKDKLLYDECRIHDLNVSGYFFWHTQIRTFMPCVPCAAKNCLGMSFAQIKRDANMQSLDLALEDRLFSVKM